MALKLGIQTYQILKNDDEVCIPSLSSILLAVLTNVKKSRRFYQKFLAFLESELY